MIQAIVFDCFGVLHLDVNSAYFSHFPQHAAELHQLNVRADHGFIGRDDFLRKASEIVGVSAGQVEAGILQAHTLNVQLADYIRTTLKSHYKIGLLSNVGRGWIEEFVDKYQIRDLFDAIVLSNEEGITKPDPRVYQHTAQKLGVAAEACVMIDDRSENCIGAEAAGMKSILFTSNEQCLAQLADIEKMA